ncbi:MAG: alpha/beta hydrolase [Rhodococcus sp. (in: high G+C Gram-positive bacteria)]|uniref:alpha/beta hydrolase n=1 Tax=Rhodococcus sp. TaxID=1831 RepID=UPI003BAE9DD1
MFSANQVASRRSTALRLGLSVAGRIVADNVRTRGFPLTVIRRGIDLGGLFCSRGTTFERVRDAPVPGLWVRAENAADSRHAIHYLHGGGFVFGSSRSHRALASRLSAAAGVPVFLPDYRLAPEHPFPAAAEDTTESYLWLLEQGYEAKDVMVGGDSAGGHLATGLLPELRRRGADLPAGVLLLSPWLDLGLETAGAREAIRRDPFLSVRFAERARESYAPGADLADPRLALLDAEPERDWPPFLIQGGDTEAICGDAEHLAKALAEVGVPCELQAWPGQVHVFHAFHPIIPEAAAAATYAGEFVRRTLAEAATRR